MGVRIRPRAPDDLPACSTLLRLTHEVDAYPRYLPDHLASFLINPSELAAWVAELGDDIVGHGALHAGVGEPAAAVAGPAAGLAADQLAVVARLMVHPDARRSGIGRGLLSMATDFAHRHGLRPVLDVQQTSEPALSLYERLGWQRAGPLTLPVSGHEALQLWVYLGPERVPERHGR